MNSSYVFSKLKASISPTATESAKIDALNMIKHNINSDFISKIHSKLIEPLFNEVWNCLLTFYGSNDPLLKSAASRSTFSFLLKFLPTHTPLICLTLSKKVYTNENSSTVKSLIISVFMQLSNFMLPQHLFSYASMNPFIDIFSSVDDLLSENITNIIKNLGPITEDWLENLLTTYLKKVTSGKYQNISAAIAAIIQRNPERFLPFFFNKIFENSELSKHLPLISYVLTVVEDVSNIDLFPAASAAIEVLKQEDANSAAIDSAFQVLSFKSQSFTVDIKKEENGILIITATSKTGEAFSTEMISGKYTDKASFYSLPLPFEYLIPLENDSPVVKAAKIKSLGIQAASVSKMPDISAVVEIFEKYLSDDNNYIVSTTTASLSYFVNRIVDNLPLLHKAILCKEENWLQCIDILTVIEKLDFTQLPYIMIKEISYRVVDFCHSKSEKLSKKAIKALGRIASPINRNFLMEAILVKLDLFDDYSTLKGIQSLHTLLLNQPELGEVGSTIVQVITEALDFHLDSAQILNASFKCLSLFRTHNKHAECIAKTFIKAYEMYITGNENETDNDQELLETLKVTAHSAIESFDMDITLGRNVNEILQPAASALRFLFNCSFTTFNQKDMCSFAKKYWTLFPYEVSNFFISRWSELNRGLFVDALRQVPQRLINVSSLEVHQTFCALLLRMADMKPEKEFKELMDIEAETSKYVLSNPVPLTTQSAFVFSQFALTFLYDSFRVTVEYLKRVDIVKQVNFISSLAYTFSNAVDLLESYVPEAVKHYKSLPSFIKVEKEESPVFLTPVKITDKETAKKEFIRASYDCNSSDMRKALREYKTFNAEFNEFEIPECTKKVVSSWLAYNHPEILQDPLKYVRTNMKNAAIAGLKMRGNAIIEKLLNTEKVKKETIYDLCAATQSVSFDTTLLFALAIKLCFESQKERRRKAAYHFLATCIANTRTLPFEIPDQFMDCVDISPFAAPEEESLVILELSRKMRPSNRIINYAIGLYNYKETFNRISLVLVSVAEVLNSYLFKDIHGSILQKLQEPLLSTRISAIRTSTQICVTTENEQILMCIEQPVFNAFKLIKSTIPAAVQESATLVINVLAKPIRQELLAEISKNTSVVSTTHKAYSSSHVYIIQAFLKAYPKSSKAYKDAYRSLLSLFSQPAYLKVLLATLNDVVRSGPQEMAPNLISQCLKESLTQPFALTIPHLAELWTCTLVQLFNPVWATGWILQSFMPFIPFYQIANVIHMIYRKSNYDINVGSTLTMAQRQIGVKVHAECLRLIIERGDFKQILELALCNEDPKPEVQQEEVITPAEGSNEMEVNEDVDAIPVVEMKEVEEKETTPNVVEMKEEPLIELSANEESNETKVTEDVDAIPVVEMKEVEEKETTPVVEINATNNNQTNEVPIAEENEIIPAVEENETEENQSQAEEEKKETTFVINENEVFDENMMYPSDDE